MPSQNKWTEPKLCPKNPKPSDINKEWRVTFKYLDDTTGAYKSIIRKSKLNYIHDFKQRCSFAKDLISAIKVMLEVQGWNPITDTYHAPKFSVDEELKKIKNLSFAEALDFAYSKKIPDWAKKTGQDYSSVIKYLKQAAKAIDLYDKKISEFKLPHFRLILEEVKTIRKLSAQGFNKFREYLSSLVTEMVSWEIVELNLVHHVKTKQAIKTFAHRPPTVDQKDLIIGKIKMNYPAYYRFLCVLYGCTLRPKEITRLKIKNLHRKEHLFRIVPEKSEENSKVKYERDAIIPEWLMEILSELNLHNYDAEDYIFSKGFMPGKKRMHSNTPTLIWRKIVKEGLGLNVNQYSLKKLSGNDMIKIQRMEGVRDLLDLPQLQMGHSTPRQTETYVTEHLEIYKEIIKNHMPKL